ncbi:hypothetical protein CsSME_00000395 [Camellia sinensis var. sinensis]
MPNECEMVERGSLRCPSPNLPSNMALGYSFHRTTVFEIFAVEFDISEPIHSFFYIPNRNHVGLEMETSRFVIFFEFSYLPPLIDILRRIDSFDFTTSLWETLEGKNKFDKAPVVLSSIQSEGEVVWSSRARCPDR